MPIPPGLYGWYKTAYPTLVFNPGWLEACVEYLQESEPIASTTPGLIKAVEKQLLSSELSTSVQLSSLANNRLLLSTIHSASSPDQDKVLYRGGTKKSWLFQIQQVDDISHSAQTLLEILQEKREWRKLKLKGGNMEGGRDMRLDDEEQGAGDEEEKLILAGGSGKEPTFPRGNGKFVLSDGENSVNAFELQRIPGLGLEEVKLGSKILVHDVTFIDGVMLLTPQNTVVKGCDVEELQQLADWTLENTLRHRIDLEPLPKPDQVNASPAPRSPTPKLEEMDHKPSVSPPAPRNAPRARSGPSTASKSRAKPSTSSSSASNRAKSAVPPPLVASTSRSKSAPTRQAVMTEDEDDYFNDSFDMDFDALQAQAQSQVIATTSGQENGKGKGRAVDQGDFDEDEDLEDDEAWNAMNEVEMRPQQSKLGTSGVKDEPRSSGSRQQKQGIGESRGAKMEVLELDSDEDEKEPNVKPVKKKIKAEGSGGKNEQGKKKKDVVVLEIDDSD